MYILFNVGFLNYRTLFINHIPKGIFTFNYCYPTYDNRLSNNKKRIDLKDKILN